MGQYYKAYVENEDGKRVFCPQNAIYMTKNGIKDSNAIEGYSWDDDNPNSWARNFSGLKLMEHAWIENDFVNGVLESIRDKPSLVAWVGDYASGVEYETVWGDTPEVPFAQVPATHKTGYIVNHNKGLCIDLNRYATTAGFSPSWDRGNAWIIHPLPLLTAIGNGKGGGDYWGINMNMVGSWAMDRLSFTEYKPYGMNEVLIPFIEK